MNFTIDNFEGPLDLLLHLIKENKMDIFNIEIVNITNQYLEYINKQQDLNLDIASEYLVLASELLELKSKMLLPSNTKDEQDIEESKEDLVNRLLEYQSYKEITKTLKEKELIRQDIYTKAPFKINDYIDDEVSINTDVTLDDLMDAFIKFLKRREKDKPLSTRVTIKEISISKRRQEIGDIIKEKKRVSFFELFPIVNKEYIVATFLAILEMAKNNEVNIIQKNNFAEIICEVPNE